MIKSVTSSDENILKGFSEIVKRGIIEQGSDGYSVVAEKSAKSGVYMPKRFTATAEAR